MAEIDAFEKLYTEAQFDFGLKHVQEIFEDRDWEGKWQVMRTDN